jgi:glucosyl-3-phosphoglycerate phosphatase
MKKLVLVRHGETEWNAKYMLQGQKDIALSPKGKLQAAAIAPLLEELKPAVALSSDLRRARDTAAILRLQPHLAPAWREVHLGAWEGRTKEELLAEDPDAYWDWRNGRFDPPGAESWEVLKARVGRALDELPQSDGSIVVVTHGGTIRAACSLLIGLDPDRIVPVDPGSMTVFHLNGAPRLRAFNITGDLSRAEPPD